MAQFTIYSYLDASAPVLHSNADANNLIALLDACLVNGYGSKAAAGWSHPFAGSGTEQAYLGASGSTQRYLHILDDGSLTGGRRGAVIRGYETMATVTDTTGLPFPTVAQDASGVVWRKSTDISATARPWIVVADGRTVYIFVATGDTGAGGSGSNPYSWPMYMFGDFFSYSVRDLYNCMLIGVPSSQGLSASAINFTSATVYEGDKITFQMSVSGSVINMVGHYVNRTLNGTQNSTANYKKGAHQFTTGSGSTQRTALLGVLDFPNGADGGAWLSPLYVMDAVVPEVIHGEFRGMYHQVHDIGNFSDGDTISAMGDRMSRTFQVIKQTPNSGVWVIETSDTLRTN